MDVVAVVVLVVLLATYITWTAQRLDRLHARVDAAWAALDAQLVRRAAAARALALVLPPGPAAEALERAATGSLAGGPVAREAVENDLSRALHAVLPTVVPPGHEELLDELEAAVTRVGLARAFHNVAVRDTRAVRFRRMPRALRLAGRRSMPQPFDIDDTALPRRRPRAVP